VFSLVITEFILDLRLRFLLMNSKKTHLILWSIGLFNNTVRNSSYIASNYGIINELRIGMDVEGSGCGLI
jgi:hypothetical protein